MASKARNTEVASLLEASRVLVGELDVLKKRAKKLEGLLASVEELSQYTGMKDKNGKKIYFDTDIVMLTVIEEGEKPKKYPGVITVDERNRFMIGDFYLINLDNEAVNDYSFEVIGSIRDNPKLLE